MIRVFFSYSHRDEAVRNELELHLSMLKRQGVIDTWHDREIEAGADLHGQISENLERADIILLLVTPYFLASDYCYDVEMRRALERHERGEARVIPVIAEPCDWKNAPFARLRATPADGKPISKFSNLNDAYLEIVTDIRKAAGSLGSGETTRLPQRESPQSASASPPRSSNLRVKKPLTDHDRDVFRDASFEYIANYFENSLSELKRRNQDLTTRFRRESANQFTAAVYAGGEKRTACGVVLGGDLAGDITYSIGDSGRSGSFNEALSVSHDGYACSLRALGLAQFGSADERDLSQEGAAEFSGRSS